MFSFIPIYNTAYTDKVEKTTFQSTLFNSSLNKVCFPTQHDKHNPNQFMSSGEDGHFIGQPLVSFL
jgi:hypothetical protein